MTAICQIVLKVKIGLRLCKINITLQRLNGNKTGKILSRLQARPEVDAMA